MDHLGPCSNIWFSFSNKKYLILIKSSLQQDSKLQCACSCAWIRCRWTCIVKGKEIKCSIWVTCIRIRPGVQKRPHIFARTELKMKSKSQDWLGIIIRLDNGRIRIGNLSHRKEKFSKLKYSQGAHSMPGFKQTNDRKHFNSRRTSLTANMAFWSFDHISQGKEKGKILYAPQRRCCGTWITSQ